MKKFLIAFALLLTSLTVYASFITYTDISDEVKYYKDDRTGLCFAAVNTSSGFLGSVFTKTSSITCVPCNAQVTKLLK